MDNFGVNQNRSRELRPAMHDAVANRVHRAVLGNEALYRPLVNPPGRSLELCTRDQSVALVEDRELDAARAGVDNQGPRQSRAINMARSSHLFPGRRLRRNVCKPSPRTRSSSMRWRRDAACEPSHGTRSITSITRWNRSRSLSMTMSNGVVVVPSSLYPRT